MGGRPTALSAPMASAAASSDGAATPMSTVKMVARANVAAQLLPHPPVPAAAASEVSSAKPFTIKCSSIARILDAPVMDSIDTMLLLLPLNPSLALVPPETPLLVKGSSLLSSVKLLMKPLVSVKRTLVVLLLIPLNYLLIKA